MPSVLLIVGGALLLMALLGPHVELPWGRRRSNRAPRDQRHATVLALRIAAAVLGVMLLTLSAAHLLHGHGSQ